MRHAIILALALGGQAIAASPALADTFDGPYAGVGAGWSRTEVSDLGLNGEDLDRDADRDSAALALFAGYNYKVTDRIVLGGEAGFSVTVDDKIRVSSAGDSLTIDPRYSFDLSARAGYLVTDRTLVYVRGGYENERVRSTLTGATGALRDNDNLDAWTVGGGVEYAITPKITARAEYRYAEFDSDGGDYDRHRTLVGLAYHF